MAQSGTIPAAGIPAAELEERRGRLLRQVRAGGASGYVLFDQSYIQYFTGFWFLSNERPVMYAESDEARKLTAAAMFWAEPSFPIGMR